MTKKQFFFVLFAWSYLLSFGQIKLEYVTAKKNGYVVGDVIDLKIALKSNTGTCLQGMKQTKIYLAGLELLSETEWKELSKGVFVKHVKIQIRESKSSTRKLTILRRVDKESLFHQEKFALQNEF